MTFVCSCSASLYRLFPKVLRLPSRVTYLTPKQRYRFICPQPVSVRAGAYQYVDLRLLDFHLWGLFKTPVYRSATEGEETLNLSKTFDKVRKPMNRCTLAFAESGGDHFNPLAPNDVPHS